MIMSPNTDGEIVAVTDTRDVVSNTYVFTKAQYTTWSETPTSAADLSSVASTAVDYVENTSEADPYFNFFYCGGSRDHTFTCYKFMPTTGANGVARFDTDSTGVAALKFVSADNAAEGTGTLTEENITLSGALAGAQATVALVAGILALSFQ